MKQGSEIHGVIEVVIASIATRIELKEAIYNEYELHDDIYKNT